MPFNILYGESADLPFSAIAVNTPYILIYTILAYSNRVAVTSYVNGVNGTGQYYDAACSSNTINLHIYIYIYILRTEGV